MKPYGYELILDLHECFHFSSVSNSHCMAVVFPVPHLPLIPMVRGIFVSGCLSNVVNRPQMVTEVEGIAFHVGKQYGVIT